MRLTGVGMLCGMSNTFGVRLNVQNMIQILIKCMIKMVLSRSSVSFFQKLYRTGEGSEVKSEVKFSILVNLVA